MITATLPKLVRRARHVGEKKGQPKPLEKAIVSRRNLTIIPSSDDTRTFHHFYIVIKNSWNVESFSSKRKHEKSAQRRENSSPWNVFGAEIIEKLLVL